MISQSTFRREQQVLEAALDLFVRNGFHGTPTSKIAAQAGVSNGTLFHYYKTKDELVIALYNRIKEEMANHVALKISEQDPLETKFKNSFLHSLYWALVNREEFHYIQQFHFSPHLAKISPEVISEQSKFHLQLIAAGLEAEILKPLPVDLIFALVSSHVFGLYQYLANADFPADQQEVTIERGFELLWRMITV